jgi:hypothetical protein
VVDREESNFRTVYPEGGEGPAHLLDLVEAQERLNVVRPTPGGRDDVLADLTVGEREFGGGCSSSRTRFTSASAGVILTFFGFLTER